MYIYIYIIRVYIYIYRERERYCNKRDYTIPTRAGSCAGRPGGSSSRPTSDGSHHRIGINI